MAFPSAPSTRWSVSLLTVLFTAAVHSNIAYGEHVSASSSVYLSVSPQAPDPLGPPLSVSASAPSLDLRLHFFPLLLFHVL